MNNEPRSGTVRFQGLTSAEVMESQKKHGFNILNPPEREPWWRQFISKFDDPVIRILMIAAIIAICTGEFIEGSGIIAAILLATVLAFLNEFKAEKEFDILNKVNDDIPVKVIRDGKFQMIPKKDVAVGDIIFIELGEECPADCKLLESVNFQVDQSKLTGESEPITKFAVDSPELTKLGESTYPAFMVMRGTPVVDGHAYAEVTAVGAATEIGKTAIAASEDTEEETPLNQQLEKLSKLIGVIGFGVASITFVALIIHGIIGGGIVQTAVQWGLSGLLLLAIIIALVKVWLPVCYDGLELLKGDISVPEWLEREGIKAWLAVIFIGAMIAVIGLSALFFCGLLPSSPSSWISATALPQFINFFMIAVTLIVVAVPEGLAMSVTLSLAYSMRKMTAANNLVRKMHACETIGAATVICTDKTGTLTMNQMLVQEAVFPRLSRPDATQEDLNFIATAISANSTANLSRLNPVAPTPIGNPTEAALLLWLDKKDIDYELVRESFKISCQWTFSTERKFMATKGHIGEAASAILWVKGAPEIVMSKCTQIETLAGCETLTESIRHNIEQQLINFQARGMRTLGFAYSNTPASGDDISQVAESLTWLGFVAIADPVRPDVPAAIQACYKAGIQVKMVTGDNIETAKEIGRQINLWDDSDTGSGTIMTGSEFAALSDEDAIKVASKLRIMARARPADKLKLVRSLKASGQIVAVTGDGTNDAPALNYADVGIAMGKTGTAIAKEASDIILLDDSFGSIVNAVMWGRSLYCNIQRFILFQLTVNVAALTIAMLGPFIGIELPLTVIQMLWVNLIMDTFAALALATEPPNQEVMNFPPRRNSAFIVTPNMWKGIFGVGIVFLAVLIALLLYIKSQGEVNNLRWLTIFFSVFVMLQFWNLFNAKCWGSNCSVFSRLLDNKSFTMIALGIFIGQIFMVQLGGSVFRTIPLSIFEWFAVIASTSVIFWGGEIYRAIGRLRQSKTARRMS